MQLRNGEKGSALIPWLPVLPIEMKPRGDDLCMDPFVVQSPSQGFSLIRLGMVTKHPCFLKSDWTNIGRKLSSVEFRQA